MARKWESAFFMLRTADGRMVPSYAPCYGGLAMLRLRAGQWSLTHIRTGMRVTIVCGERRDAYDFAATVANLTDWSTVEVATKELADRVAEVCRVYQSSPAIAPH